MKKFLKAAGAALSGVITITLVVVFAWQVSANKHAVETAELQQQLAAANHDERLAPTVELFARMFCGEYRATVEGNPLETRRLRLEEWHMMASVKYNRSNYAGWWPKNLVSLVLYGNEVNAIADRVVEDMDSVACQEAKVYATEVVYAIDAGTFVPSTSGLYWATPAAAANSADFQKLLLIAEGPAHNVYTHNVRPRPRPECIATNSCGATATAPKTSPRPKARPSFKAVSQIGTPERIQATDNAVREALGQRL